MKLSTSSMGQLPVELRFLCLCVVWAQFLPCHTSEAVSSILFVVIGSSHANLQVHCLLSKEVRGGCFHFPMSQGSVMQIEKLLVDYFA